MLLVDTLLILHFAGLDVDERIVVAGRPVARHDIRRLRETAAGGGPGIGKGAAGTNSAQ